jgi:N,N'-diacetyllegionaminate synthase
MTPSELRIGARRVGPGHPAYLVAEIGINHNGDLDLARRTVEAAKAAGADAVKFQTYRTEEFIGSRDLTWTQQVDGRTEAVSQFDMFKANELSDADLDQLIGQCREIGIDWHATPMSPAGVTALVARGVEVLKNGSDCLGHLPLIRAMGQSGLPTVISTGMATLGDIEEAVAAFRATGNDLLILLLCSSQYPCPPEEVNLRRMATLAAAFGCPVGFSDHTEGDHIAASAAALGACWIEKHFTFDKALPGPDHLFSADKAEFAELVKGVRMVEAALGASQIALTPREAQARAQHRLSCAAGRDLPEGHRLEAEDIAFLRPGTGRPPRDVALLVGRRLARSLPRGALLTEEALE